ncbi:MAG: hypothetical protein JOZ54_21070 [Acidobacteria bacterium]|nr:hypothetical protein [Acidobacteriota bacterium]
MHLKQKGHDTCGIAACTMIGQSLGCTLPPGDVLAFAEKKGIYVSGQKSFFHALDQIFTMMGLSSNMANGKSDAALTALVQQVGVVLVETGSHVIVVDGARQTVNGYSYDVRDPAFTKSETNVSHNDPRLKDRTGRVWAVWR